MHRLHYACFRQNRSFDLARRFIHIQVRLAPGTALAVPVLRTRPPVQGQIVWDWPGYIQKLVKEESRQPGEVLH